MVTKSVLALSALLGAAGLSSASAATVIDFTDREDGIQPGSLSYPEVEFTSSSGRFSIIESYYDDSNRLCAYGDVFTGCSADWTAAFAGPVSDLSFRAEGQNASDSAIAQIFDGEGALLGSIDVDSDGIYDFGGVAGISSLVVESVNATGNGISYTDVAFEAADVAPIPLPAGLPLAVGALGVLGVVARRKRG